jgi:hypothetical protein
MCTIIANNTTKTRNVWKLLFIAGIARSLIMLSVTEFWLAIEVFGPLLSAIALKAA